MPESEKGVTHMTKYYAIFLVDISVVCEPTYVRVDFESDFQKAVTDDD
jgi:hypothetical protein